MAGPTRPSVVLTRAPEDNARLREGLEADGVPVREIPCAGTRLLDPGPLPDDAVAILFPSRRALEGARRAGIVPSTARRQDCGRGWREAPGEGGGSGKANRPWIGAVGPATARALVEAGIRVDAIADPPEGRVLAEMLVRALPDRGRVILARGTHPPADDPMVTRLEDAGFVVHLAIVYENVAPPIEPVDPFPVAAVFVAAPSAVRRLLGALPWMREAPFFTIGNPTLEAAREAGVFRVQALGPDPETWRQALLNAAFSPLPPAPPPEGRGARSES